MGRAASWTCSSVSCAVRKGGIGETEPTAGGGSGIGSRKMIRPVAVEGEDRGLRGEPAPSRIRHPPRSGGPRRSRRSGARWRRSRGSRWGWSRGRRMAHRTWLRRRGGGTLDGTAAAGDRTRTSRTRVETRNGVGMAAGREAGDLVPRRAIRPLRSGLDGARIFTAMSSGPAARADRARTPVKRVRPPTRLPMASGSTVMASEPRRVWRGCTRTVA